MYFEIWLHKTAIEFKRLLTVALTFPLMMQAYSGSSEERKKYQSFVLYFTRTWMLKDEY